MSILLACIANKLEQDSTSFEEWTPQVIRRKLTNPEMPSEKKIKLQLQTGDKEEYDRGLNGAPEGAGSVAQAWKIAKHLVDRSEVSYLLRGLERLQVVSIGLIPTDDPQQIFESLNATGRPLTEAEKVKNWFLIGLPEEEQLELHDKTWCRIEQALGAQYSTDPVDTFLRDFMRWKTGEVHGIDKTYEQLRRWALKEGYTEAKKRSTLCRELARLAELYGILTGTKENHLGEKVDKEIRHLRALGLDVHRPLTLRLLHETDSDSMVRKDLAKILGGVGTWITRLWLAERSTAGINKAMAVLAHETGPGAGKDCVGYWFDRIRAFRNQRIGVPKDADIREGIRKHKAYGSGATKPAFAVLCELMETDENHGEAPARDRLTVEHVMPQKLTVEWKSYLGEGAEELHGQYCNQLPNLTLSGDVPNAGMGADTFTAKREVYRKSSIGMTRKIGDEAKWDEAALSRRADDLARRVLERWPWSDDQASADETRENSERFRWRIEGGPWHTADTGSQLVLNVAGELLSRNLANVEKLSGKNIKPNVHLAKQCQSGNKIGSMTLRFIPGHPDYVLYPYERDYPTSAKRCKKMGERCGVKVQVELPRGGEAMAEKFWKFLANMGGVPGQKDNWRGASQWTSPFNDFGDRVGIYVGPDSLGLYGRAGGEKSVDRAKRMCDVSRMICDQMSDQCLSGDLESQSKEGRTVYIEQSWIRDDEESWDEAGQWIQDQSERLHTILGSLGR